MLLCYSCFVTVQLFFSSRELGNGGMCDSAGKNFEGKAVLGGWGHWYDFK